MLSKTIEDPPKVEEYCRVISPETQLPEEAEEVCLTLLECLTFRDKWLFAVRPDLNPATSQVGGSLFNRYDFPSSLDWFVCKGFCTN